MSAEPFQSRNGPIPAEEVTLRISVALADKIRAYCYYKLYTWDTFVESSILKHLVDERVITPWEATLADLIVTHEKKKQDE